MNDLNTHDARAVSETLAQAEREFGQAKRAGQDLTQHGRTVRRLALRLDRAGYDRRGMPKAQHWTERLERWIHVRLPQLRSLRTRKIR